MANFELLHFDSDEQLAANAAKRWMTELEKTAFGNSRYCAALSGGRSAAKFFEAAVAVALAQKTSLANVHFFWADERCVAPENPESNFGLAQRLLFQPLKIGPDQIHRIRGEAAADFAAAEAEAEICRIAPLNSAGLPVLDLALLGMGEDGHVASLFPGAPTSVTECRAVYCPVTGPKPPPRRITMTMAALAAARQAWVLVSGKTKDHALRESIDKGGKTPLAELLRRRQKTTIFASVKF